MKQILKNLSCLFDSVSSNKKRQEFSRRFLPGSNELPRCKQTEYQNSILYCSLQAAEFNSFIPTRCAIGIRLTCKFQFITFLKFEFHE